MTCEENRFSSINIETEKKYIVSNKKVFDKIIRLFEIHYNNYFNCSGKSKLQSDQYYDTNDNLLFNSNKILRIRDLGEIYVLTIKSQLSKKHEDFLDIELSRYEYEFNIASKDINKNKDIIIKYLPELLDYMYEGQLQLPNVMTIKNNRMRAYLEQNKIKYEIAFDDVTYISPYGNYINEYQVEIELKSFDKANTSLRMLTQFLETNIAEVEFTRESKFRRGLRLLKFLE